MGQRIDVAAPVVVDNVAVFTTDRNLTSMDGEAFDDLDAARERNGFPARLAEALFEGVDGLDHVFVAANSVVARRRDGWDGPAVTRARQVVADLFVHYRD